MKKALILTVLLAIVPALGFSQTGFTVRNAAGWIEAVNGIRNGGNSQAYTITVTGIVSVPAAPSKENTFGTVTCITVTIEGSGTLSPSNNGSLLRIGKDQTIVAKDLTLKGRDANNAAVVYIAEGGTFRMEGKASVTGNTYPAFGGGVYVNGGTFTMQDSASVSGNKATFDGGGVYVGASYNDNNRTGIQGTFTMQDSASVSGNTGRGGVYVSGGIFTMSGGTISGNTSSGVYVDYSSSINSNRVIGGAFTMIGGTISGNNRSGVYVSGGTFSMQGGTISGNTYSSDDFSSFSSGGGVYVGGSGTFTMIGGTISGNTSYSSGGGVYSGGTFTMEGDASISGNKSSSGGGVYVGGGTFTMKGDTSVSGNKSSDSGGGVYNGGTFTMEGGTISGNTATFSGGGVYVASSYSTFTKTGGIIHGDDAEQKLKNTVISRLGHALYEARDKGWRNATARPTMNSDGYGFWLNDGDVVMFPFEGRYIRSNFNNTLTIRANVIKSSSSNYYWILQKISGNAYTLKRADATNTMTLSIRRDGDNLVISGDSGSGENNWNGNWWKLN